MNSAINPSRTIVAISLGFLWTLLPLVTAGAALWELGAITDLLHASRVPPLGCVTAFILLSGSGLLPTRTATFILGWAYGSLAGFTTAWVGLVGGTAIGWLLARYLAGDALASIACRNRTARILRAALTRGAATTIRNVALLRLPTQSPFALGNFVLAGMSVSFRSVVVGTLIGVLPKTLLYASMGAALASTGSTDLESLVKRGAGDGWPLIFNVGAAILALWLLGRASAYALRDSNQSPQPQP